MPSWSHGCGAQDPRELVPEVVSDVGLLFLDRFQRSGRAADATAAISLLRAGVEAAQDGHRSRGQLLCNLGYALLEGELQPAEQADGPVAPTAADEVVAVFRAALDSTALDHPNFVRCACGLALSLRSQALLTGDAGRARGGGGAAADRGGHRRRLRPGPRRAARPPRLVAVPAERGRSAAGPARRGRRRDVRGSAAGPRAADLPDAASRRRAPRGAPGSPGTPRVRRGGRPPGRDGGSAADGHGRARVCGHAVRAGQRPACGDRRDGGGEPEACRAARS